MTEPEQAAMRSAGERARAAGHPTHPLQDDDGAWFDVPCNCDRTGSAEQMIADLELLRSGGPVIDRAMREAGFLIEEPHHAAARDSTREEREAAAVARLRRERSGVAELREARRAVDPTAAGGAR